MCRTSCLLLGLECRQYVLMRNDRDVMVNFEPVQYIFESKHISPRCNSCKPNLHHSPLKGKTIIFESRCTSAYKVAFGPRGP